MARQSSRSHCSRCTARAASGVLGAALVIALVALACGCGEAKVPSSPVALAGDAAWQAIDLHANIRGLAFTSAEDGWAVGVGDGGWVFATTDGGRGWLRQSVPHPEMGLGDHLNSVDFADARHGWIVGGDLILATSDAGAHWEVQRSPLRPLSQVTFTDARRGWILTGNDVLLATTDGGTRWSVRARFSVGEDVSAIDFVDSQDGWGVGDGSIEATTDGGFIWRRQTLPRMPKGWFLDLNAVTFTTNRCGWAVGAMMDPTVVPIPEKSAVLHTTDGGATWRLQDTSGLSGFLWAVSFADPLHGWVAGDVATKGKLAGIVVATDDGGTTWREQVRGPVGSQFRAVAFPDAHHGCVAGSLMLTTASGALP